MKKIVAVMLAGVLSLSLFAGCGGSGAKNDKLIIGLDPEFPPMGFKDESGKIIGFDIDLANEVGKVLGVEMEFQPIDWDSKELELDSGKIDMIWNGFTITEERAEKTTLTKPYLKNNQIIVVPINSAIQNKSDLAGKKLTLQKGSTAISALKADPISEQLASMTELASNVDCFMELEMGRSEVMVVDEVVAKYYLKINEGKFRILEDTMGAEEYAIGVKKGNKQLKEKLETAISQVVKDGKAKEISEKWFGEDIVYWN